MKCPYCGGEVSSQSIACPYCGRDNQEGIAFQEEVRRKIERNKLLKPFLMKQKTPELVQRMLTRIVIIIAAVNVLLFVVSLGSYVVCASIEAKREPIADSYAEYYLENYRELHDYYFDIFWDDMISFVDALDAGEVPETEDIEYLVNRAHRVLEQRQEAEQFEDIYEFEVAFFRGFLGLTEEESAFLEPDEDGKYRYLMSDDANLIRAVEAIEKRVKEEAP